jgi:hypothetical protein
MRNRGRSGGERSRGAKKKAPDKDGQGQSSVSGNVDDLGNRSLSRAPMQSSLRSRLGELANEFSASVLDAIRGASLEELLSESSGARSRGPSVAAAPRARQARQVPAKKAAPAAAAAPAAPAKRRGGRLPRRSSGDIAGVVASIVGLLRASPAGLRAEEIRSKLGLQAKELPRPLKEGLDTGTLSKTGQKRATTYFARGAGSKAAARPGRPAAKRAGRPAKAASAKKRVGARAGAGVGSAKKKARARS